MAGGTGTGWETPGSTVTPAAPNVGGGPGTGSGTGWESPGSGVVVPHAGGGGGGGFLGGIGHFVGGAGHWIASKASLAGHDIAQIPGGLINQTEAGLNDYLMPNLPGVGGLKVGGNNFIGVNDKSAPQNLLGGLAHSLHETASHPLRDPFSTLMWLLPIGHGLGHVGLGAADAASALRAGDVGGVVKALKSPELMNTPRMLRLTPEGKPVTLAESHNALRRLYQSAHDQLVQKAIDEKPNGVVARYGYSRMHGSMAEISRARVRMRQAVVSNLRRSTQPLKGEVASAAKKAGVELTNSPKTIAQAAVELVQHNTTPEEGILRAEHAIETARAALADPATHPDMIPHLHEAVALNEANRGLYNEVNQLDLVHNHGATVGINPEFKSLHRSEGILSDNGNAIDQQIAERGMRPAEQLANRKDVPAAVTARMEPFQEKVVTPALRSAREDYARVDKAYTRALAQEHEWHYKSTEDVADASQRVGGPSVPLDNPYRERVNKLGERHQLAFERVQRLEKNLYRGAEGPADMRPTLEPSDVTRAAIMELHDRLPELLRRKIDRNYGGDVGRFADDMVHAANGTLTDPAAVRMLHQLTQATLEGKTFTPLTTLDRGVSSAPMARPRGTVIGEPTDPLNKNHTSGTGLLAGHHQADVTEAVASHWHSVFRFFNRQDWQQEVARTGYDVNRTKDDILVRNDGRVAGGEFSPTAAGKITQEAEQFLGRVRDRGYTPQMEAEDAGIVASLQQFVDHVFPGRQSGTEAAALEERARGGATGLDAPKGYKWVPKQVVGDLNVPVPATSGLAYHTGNLFDNLNSAVTAATVYFKLGHFGTRYLTNAAANIMQGSANPLNLRAAAEIAHGLTPEEKLAALASAGTHYYEALPGAEGQGRISHFIQRGVPGTKTHVLSPQWWAGYVDAPFRLNSLVFEMRKSGAYADGIEGMRQYLSDLHDYNHLDGARQATVDGIVRRANREAIAYDRLNDFEKRYLSRAVWFYPWVKGSTVWTANAMLEHPFKSFVAGQAGVQGVAQQKAEFGDVPSYSYGVFMFAHGEPFPLAADFSTFNPEATAGQLLQAPSHLNDVSGMLNPGLGALYHVIGSTDSRGNHTNHPLSAALQEVVSPTPESQVVQAYLGRNADQSHREYPAVKGDPFSKTYVGEILRSLLGPGTPRRFNPEAAHSLAQRERTGR